MTAPRKPASAREIVHHISDRLDAAAAVAINRLIHRYVEHRNRRRAFRLASAEKKIVAPYEGRRWCDATERELISDIRNIRSWHL
jgi:hypothetical protein